MPSKSKAQHNFMAAVAHNPSFAKKVGVPTSVGKDFNQADKGRKFLKGGDTMASKMNPGFMAMMKKKAPAKKMAMGGMPSRDTGTGSGPRNPGSMSMPPRDIGTGGNPNPRRAPLAQAINKPGMMKKGGVIASKMGAVKTAAPSKDGVAIKGKTKGKMIAMAKGGKTMKSGGKTC